jgi:hypothetical protein
MENGRQTLMLNEIMQTKKLLPMCWTIELRCPTGTGYKFLNTSIEPSEPAQSPIHNWLFTVVKSAAV